MDPVIDTHNVYKIFNEKTIPVNAVNGVHIHIEGEFGGRRKVIINGKNITEMSSKQLIEFRLNNIGFVSNPTILSLYLLQKKM